MENQNRKLSKKRIAVIAAIVCCIALVAAGSLAYFTAEETAYNVITTATLDMTLHEETTGGKPFPEEGITGVMPATEVDKKVYVENTGEADFWCRISIEKSIQAAEGVDAKLNFDHITLDINTADWTEKDGYYYYNRPVKSGEFTEPLFTQVIFGKELGNEYMNATVVIKVHAQTVQCKNNGTSALDAMGWPEAE